MGWGRLPLGTGVVNTCAVPGGAWGAWGHVCFFISGISRTPDSQPPPTSSPRCTGQLVRPGLERRWFDPCLMLGCQGGRGEWSRRSGPMVGASGSEFGAEEASVILKTCVYSFVRKAWLFFRSHESPALQLARVVGAGECWWPWGSQGPLEQTGICGVSSPGGPLWPRVRDTLFLPPHCDCPYRICFD